MVPSIHAPDLDRVFVGRRLLGRVYGALLAAHDEALGPFGITVYQGSVLLNVARQEANTPAALAALNGLDISTMSRMIDRLEKKGLLTRAHSTKDRRQVLVRITPKGRAIVRKGLPVAQRVALRAWRGVTEQERQAFRSLVQKVLTNLGHTQGT